MNTPVRRTTRYAQLAGELLAAIHAGDYPVGELLPTEMALCQRHGVSRITVRAAIRELELRGLVSRRAGVGTRVESQASPGRFVHTSDSIESFVQSVTVLGFHLLSRRNRPSDATLAAESGFAEGAELTRAESLRIDAAGVPVCYSIHHLPRTFAACLRAMHGRTGSLASLIAAEAGEEVAEIRQRVEPHNLASSEARLLKVRRHDAALLSCRWYVGASGRVLLYSRSLFPKGRYSHEMRLRRENAGL
jgi:DNA-binding GntR family transcriptional regulator